MGAISKTRFVELATSSDVRAAEVFSGNARAALTPVGNGYGDYPYSIQSRINPITHRYELSATPLNREAAAQMYDDARIYLQANGRFNSKAFRPWEIDDQLYSQLDRSESWWGFEFEQGFSSQKARAEVLGHVWDSWDGVAFDSEGEGRWATEITFTPQERSKFDDGTAMAAEFMQYIGNNPRLMNNTGNSGVGMHFNVSHPEVQGLATTRAMSEILNNTLRFTSPPEKDQLFGRARLYGGFYAQAAPTGETWMEGKTFRTTYDSARFAEYLKTCAALNDIIDAVVEHWDSIGSKTPNLGVDNLTEMVSKGAEPNIVEVKGMILQGSAGSTNQPFESIPVPGDDNYHGPNYCCEECNGPYDEWEENN